MTGLVLLALAPVFIIAFFIYFRDKYEKEPWTVLLKALLAGAIIVFPILFAEQFMSWVGEGLKGVGGAAWKAFMVASLCEETFKFIALLILFWNHKEFNEKYDGIIYASFIALGFAGIENLLYVTNSGISTGLARALTAVPAHALMGVSMGFFLGLARFYPKKRQKYFIQSFLFPFVLHGIYDFILMSGLNYLLILFIPLVIFMWLTALKKMKQLNETSYFRNDLKIDLDFSKVKEFQFNSNEDQVL